MAPKKKSDVGDVDGVPYILNIASKVIVLGTGLVSNDERDTFKLKATSSLEEQARARPTFKALAAAAAAAAAAQSGLGDDPVADGNAAADVGDADAASIPAHRLYGRERWRTRQSQLRELPVGRYSCWRHSDSIWAQRQFQRRTDPYGSAYGGRFRSEWQADQEKRKRSRALSEGLLQSDLGGSAWTQEGYYVAKASAEEQREAARREFDHSQNEAKR